MNKHCFPLLPTLSSLSLFPLPFLSSLLPLSLFPPPSLSSLLPLSLPSSLPLFPPPSLLLPPSLPSSLSLFPPPSLSSLLPPSLSTDAANVRSLFQRATMRRVDSSSAGITSTPPSLTNVAGAQDTSLDPRWSVTTNHNYSVQISNSNGHV